MNYLELPNFITEEECKSIINLLSRNLKKETKIVIDESLASDLVKIIGKKLPEYRFTNHITVGFTSKAIRWHIDPKMDPRVTHRLFIYLEVPSKGGGTFFEEGIKIDPVVGKAVIFDINLRHRGEDFPPGEIKKIVGFRMYKA